MTTTLKSHYSRRTIGLLTGFTAAFLCMSDVSAVNAAEPFVLSPTPLVLKDGRIAEVSIHTFSFDPKSTKLDVRQRAQMIELISPVATDCFLTAQAIGHVNPGAGSDGETIEAHRLARGRADFVHKELSALGIDEDSVASVWDWQFLVQEPRVTLWVFSLKDGEDCEGKPLKEGTTTVAQSQAPASTPDQTASSETPKQEAETSSTTPSSTTTADASVTEQDAPVESRTAVAAASAETASEQASGNVLSSEEQEATAQSETVVATTNASSNSETSASDTPASPANNVLADANAETGEAGNDAPKSLVAATKPATAEIDSAAVSSEMTDAGSLAITFDVNSSWLPQGASGDLGSFLASLPRDGSYKVDISGAVGIGDVKDATPEAAAKYNRWMAERRVARISEWLEKNAAGRNLDMAESYVDRDSSRQVRISVKRIR